MVGRSKTDVRRDLLRRRVAQQPDVRAALSRAVQARFLELATLLGGTSLALYSPIRGEVETDIIFERSKLKGKQIAFPLVLPDDRQLEFHRVDDLSQLTPGRFGIPEPRRAAHTRVDPGTIDVIAVPGIAFDRDGRRLGYGGGYYDRLLGSAATRPHFVIGVAFDEQLLDEVPNDARDASMDGVVTESHTYSRVI